jgi:cyclic pyranopterin phosphate synthase
MPRSIYLRLSIHDGCNLRCLYCRPERERAIGSPPAELDNQALLGLVRAMAEVVPVRKVRLTGGEPLVRPDAAGLVASLRATLPEAELTLTTNGVLLDGQAEALRQAGLHRLNVSLDTLEPEAYARLTRGGRLKDVLAGLGAAERAGFRGTRLNTVLLRSLHPAGLPALARLAARTGCDLRLIELMPISVAAGLHRLEFLPAGEALTALAAEFEHLGPLPADGGTASRHRFQVDGQPLSVGLIPSVSEPFCAGCDRLRLSCRGRLFPCLRQEEGLDLGEPFRAGALAEVAGRIRRVLEAKCPPESLWPGRQMSAIGG